MSASTLTAAARPAFEAYVRSVVDRLGSTRRTIVEFDRQAPRRPDRGHGCPGRRPGDGRALRADRRTAADPDHHRRPRGDHRGPHRIRPRRRPGRLRAPVEHVPRAARTPIDEAGASSAQRSAAFQAPTCARPPSTGSSTARSGPRTTAMVLAGSCQATRGPRSGVEPPMGRRVLAAVLAVTLFASSRGSPALSQPEVADEVQAVSSSAAHARGCRRAVRATWSASMPTSGCERARRRWSRRTYRVVGASDTRRHHRIPPAPAAFCRPDGCVMDRRRGATGSVGDFPGDRANVRLGARRRRGAGRWCARLPRSGRPGRRGGRFVYLTWGDVGPDGTFNVSAGRK